MWSELVYTHCILYGSSSSREMTSRENGHHRGQQAAARSSQEEPLALMLTFVDPRAYNTHLGGKWSQKVASPLTTSYAYSTAAVKRCRRKRKQESCVRIKHLFFAKINPPVIHHPTQHDASATHLHLHKCSPIGHVVPVPPSSLSAFSVSLFTRV